MEKQQITYEIDGLSLNSQLFWEEHATRQPGVLVFPEAFGMNEHALARAERLARMGYVALACDLHGDGQIISDMTTLGQTLSALFNDRQRIRSRASASLDALNRSSRVDSNSLAAIGFCFGGTMALELARSGANIAATVGFHSGLSSANPKDAQNIKGRVLVCLGADDPYIPPQQRMAFEEEMQAADVDWQMTVYGRATHGFTNPEAEKWGDPKSLRYDANADSRSWNEMASLFAAVLSK